MATQTSYLAQAHIVVGTPSNIAQVCVADGCASFTSFGTVWEVARQRQECFQNVSLADSLVQTLTQWVIVVQQQCVK